MKNITTILLSLLFWPCMLLYGQVRHMDYLGAGHNNNVNVRASSSFGSIARTTVDGFDISNDEQLIDASRFLAQCTFGADFSTIQMLAAMGYEAWLEEQFSLPEVSYLQESIDQSKSQYGFGYRLFGSTWTTLNLTTPDILRQRMSFNLSQIMVLSGNTMMIFQRTDAHPLSAYYDMLQSHSFGNYYNLLYDVSLSPQMGHFLSHYNNPKADPANNIHPDENFAREIMQLFSIGLWQLNKDGSRRRDAQGQLIPSYDNQDIKEMAEVFTGLGPNIPGGQFGNIFPQTNENWVKPMRMYEAFHDTSDKILLNNTILPAGQSGMDDISQTIEMLSTHDNTAPFICQQLIQKFTTSNPSPQYINDVVDVFDPFEEGNFKELIKAILLHPEARNCDITEHYSFGKLREPMVRMMNWLRAFPMSTNQNGDYFNFLRCPIYTIGQAPLQAPSVFNFFSPDYIPQGPIGQNNLKAPEFQILTAPNTIGIINDTDNRVIEGIYMEDGCGIFGMFEPSFYEEDVMQYEMDHSEALSLADDEEELVQYLNILLANGLLSEYTKEIISESIAALSTAEEKLKLAAWAILISPDYAILK